MASQVLQLALRTPEKVKPGTDEAVVSVKDMDEGSLVHKASYGDQIRLG